MSSETELFAAHRRTIKQMLDEMPEDFVGFVNGVKSVDHAFRAELAARLETRLNDHLVTVSTRTLDEQRSMAASIDEITRSLGLCVTHDGKPALLIAELAERSRPETAHYVTLEGRSRGFRRVANHGHQVPQIMLAALPEGGDDLLRAAREYAFYGAPLRGR